MKPRVYHEEMTCVLPSSDAKGSIYIGNLQAAQNLLTLQKNQIKSVLTSCSGVFLCHPKSDIPYYLYIPGQDIETFDLSRYFNQAALFIKESVDKTNILVHCMAGISRSVALVIAYLIKYRQMGTQDALALVKGKRNMAQPNKGFISQLKKFEGQLKLSKIKMQSIFSAISSDFASERVQSSRGTELKNTKCPSKYESMNRSALFQNQSKVISAQSNCLRSQRRNSIQPSYSFQSVQPSTEMTYPRFGKNLDEINVKIEGILKNGTNQKRANMKSSLKISRKYSQKPKKKVTFSPYLQYFEAQPQQAKYKTNETRITKCQYTPIMNPQCTQFKKNIDMEINRPWEITKNSFSQSKTQKKISEFNYQNNNTLSSLEISQIDKKIQAITKKYDQHLFQNSKRVLANNFLNNPQKDNQRQKRNFSFERQNREQIKTRKYSQLDRKQLDAANQIYSFTLKSRLTDSNQGFQYKNWTTDENILSGNRTIDRILQRKNKYSNVGSIRRNNTRYADTINFNY